MSKSLADQLLGAGLVDSKKAKKLQKEKRQQKKQKRQQPSDDAARLQQERAERTERDRELNRQRQATEEARARQAQVRQLLETHRVRGGGDIRYQFADPRDRKIKQIYVSHDIRERLARGLLAICSLDEGYCIVPADAADRIAERMPEAVVFRLDVSAVETEADDPYRDFPIPDDIDW